MRIQWNKVSFREILGKYKLLYEILFVSGNIFTVIISYIVIKINKGTLYDSLYLLCFVNLLLLGTMLSATYENRYYYRSFLPLNVIPKDFIQKFNILSEKTEFSAKANSTGITLTNKQTDPLTVGTFTCYIVDNLAQLDVIIESNYRSQITSLLTLIEQAIYENVKDLSTNYSFSKVQFIKPQS
jgi:hypothetical protein